MAKKNVINEELVQEEQVVTAVEETAVVEKPWDGQTTRAYRSFAVPMGSAVAESFNAPVDGGQEEA
jgi:hypothetical protein